MSQAAWMQNCLYCRAMREMQRGRLLFEDRPCPVEKPPRRKNAVHVSPSTVREYMPRGWTCEVKPTLGGGAK